MAGLECPLFIDPAVLPIFDGNQDLGYKAWNGAPVVMKLADKPAHSTLALSHNTKTLDEISAEKHYSVLELAEIWNLSENTIRRIFEHEPGVLRWGSKEGRFKRRYTTLRIPETVVLRVHRRLREAG